MYIKLWLEVWRGGAARTQTRMQGAHDDGTHDLKCGSCQAPYPLARHLWANCPRLAALRQALTTEY